MKELILVRHAKSDWPDGTDDLLRPLSERGRNDCIVAANYFITLPDLSAYQVHVSVALRTQETWRHISEKLHMNLSHKIVDEIYEASLGDLLSYLEKQDAEKMIFLGHNPGLALLGSFLTGEKILKFPTLSIWHLRTETEWLDQSAETVCRLAPRAESNSLDLD